MMRAKKNISILKILTIFLMGNSLSFSQGIDYSGQETLSEEYERNIELLDEKESIRYEIEEKILYLRNKADMNGELYFELLIEYEELKKELIRDMEILKKEIKR